MNRLIRLHCHDREGMIPAHPERGAFPESPRGPGSRGEAFNPGKMGRDGARQVVNRREGRSMDTSEREFPGVRSRQQKKPAEALPGSGRPGASPLVQIFFFGKFRVAVGDQVIDEEAWTTRKARSLFAFLGSKLGEPQSEDRLMSIFWPEGSVNPRHALHNCVTVIRKIFSPFLVNLDMPIIQKKKAGYCLNRGPGCHIDVEEFQKHLSRGRALLEKGHLNEGLAELHAAGTIYTGNFLEGFHDEWSEVPRQAVRNDYLEVMHTRGKYFLEEKKFQLCIDCWNKALAADNCFEGAYFGLMISYAALENRMEAIRVYHQCTRAMKKEFNLPAPAKLRELYDRIMLGQNVPLEF